MSFTEDFIAKSEKIHGDRYDYSKTVYEKVHLPVIIICQIHGEFSQTPNLHLSGAGCYNCGNKIPTIKELIEVSNKIHKNKYDYSKYVYGGNKEKSIIICKTHGEFLQSMNKHISREHGCPTCSDNVSGKQLKWLESLNIEGLKFGNDEFKIGIYKADGYDEKTKTVYEYHGCYWHGCIKCTKGEENNYFNSKNGKTFKELYEKTQEKKNYIIDQGYNYVEKWECEM